MGEIVKSLVREGNIGISSRGLGTVNESGYVNEAFTLLCWDIVADASNPGSKFMNGILEGKTFEISKAPKTPITVKEATDLYMNYCKSLIEDSVKKI